MKQIKLLPPFKNFILENFPFIEEDFDALTNYELLCNVVNYVKTMGNEFNDIIINFNELQDLFVELKNYVDNYFDSTDFQALVDNRLDELVEDGTLERLLNNKLNITTVLDTYADMIEIKDTLEDGMKIKLLGYYSANDGGESYYLITDTEPSTYNVDLENGLYAELLYTDSINVKQFGAYGDNTHDDATYIQSALDALEDGLTLYFPPTSSYYKVNDTLVLSSKNNIKIKNAKINGLLYDDVGIDPLLSISSCDNVIIEDCSFTKSRQTILIYTANNIKINKCNFYETGYSIIQQEGYVSNNVIITECYAYHLRNDFVECNCESTAPSKNWIISNNIYDGLLADSNQVERRFVGCTYIDGLVIEGNVATRASGTSAIHIEDPTGNVLINGNIIKDCRSYGCVSLHSPASKNVLISSNIFENSVVGLTGPLVFIYGETETSKTNVVIEGNKFIGNGTQSDPIQWNYINDYRGLVKNNTFIGFDYFMDNTKYVNTRVDYIGNKIKCNNLFNYTPANVSFNTRQLNFISNILICNITLNNDKNGTTAKQITFSDNYIEGDISIQNAEDIILKNNTICYGKTVTFNASSYYANRMYAYNNYILGTGFNPSDNYPA